MPLKRKRWEVRVYSNDGVLVGISELDSEVDSWEGKPIVTRKQAQTYADERLTGRRDYARVEEK